MDFLPWLAAVAAAITAAAISMWMRRQRALSEGDAEKAAHAATLGAIHAAASAEAGAIRRQAEIDARAAAQDARTAADGELRRVTEELEERGRGFDRREQELERRVATVEEKGAVLATRDQALRDLDGQTRARRDEIRASDTTLRQTLERAAGETGADIKSRLIAEWLEQARTAAADRLRRVEAGINDPEHTRTAKRLMGIAVQRYHGHYLTERLLTNLPIPIGALPRIAGVGDEQLRIIEEVSHVKLQPAETGESIRLDGQDSFGREIARRAITRFTKHDQKSAADARKVCLAIAEELDREVMDLGRKAFKELEIPRAHPDIVKLVGKLNYRTSYTQNQWKHAIEAAFLCGMIASELGLDVKLARRAALMHDIGKALTHEIDGSHAVIGADLARKLGESEVVANAIGAHHTDEPFNSTYAYLVAATDAMSGARPGARRQQDDNYAERLEQLVMIARRYAGVDRAFAVHGGREVRVHVEENRVSDGRAVELSSEIAAKISEEMTFPGQIKVTVIREVRATEIAN